MRFQMVLTASIHPKGMFVKVADSDTRKQQYLRAFRALLDNADPIVNGITFLENTGADLGDFRELAEKHNPHGKQVELLSLDLNDYPRELGIGYGEFRLMDAGVAASKVLSPEHYIVKLTGRLIVTNLASILAAMPAQFDMAADLRVPKDPAFGWLESRLMLFSYNFYQQKIVGTYKNVNGSKNITAEHCLYQVVRNTPGMRIIPRLPREPKWVGFSGSTGMRYDSLPMKLKYPAKVLRRAITRWRRLPDVRAIWASAVTQESSSRTAESSAFPAN